MKREGKGNDGIFCGAAIELKGGTIVTGKNSPLMHAASSVVLNAIKTLAGIPDEIHLLPELAQNDMGHNWWTIDLCFWPEAWEVTAQSKQFVDKLIGMPRGIVGSERGGILTNQVKDNPYTVVLLDEIDKIARKGEGPTPVFPALSDDRENEFLADGITEDLITALSRVKGLRVPARSRRAGPFSCQSPPMMLPRPTPPRKVRASRRAWSSTPRRPPLPSTTRSAARASLRKLATPGVSTRLILCLFHSTKASPVEIVIFRWISSSS